MVGRLDIEKDQKTAISAMKYLKDNYGLDKKLLLVGDGPLKEDIEEFIKANDMQDNVVMTGNRSDVINFYKSAEILVHSSPLEGLPTVLLEAMCYDLPIAATNSLPGVEEILQGGKYGLISPVGDYKALAENIKKLYDEPALRADLAEKGRQRLEDFSFEAAKCKVEALLQTVINRKY